MKEQTEFEFDLLRHVPHLRAFARGLANDRALADDLVQDTLVRAIANRHQFCMGTNLRGWLIIILRNRFFNEMRRSSRKSEVSYENQANLASISGGQEVRVELEEFKRAFALLPAQKREALMLTAVNGFSYEEAASIAGCAVGTMKSRVSRARLELQVELEGVERPELWNARQEPANASRRITQRPPASIEPAV